MSAIPGSIVSLIEALTAEGDWTIGEVMVRPGWRVLHRADEAMEAGLTIHTWPEEAREIAKYDQAGVYRPLKGAPTLRRGWTLHLESAHEIRLALDAIYPAALGTFLAALRGEIHPVPLRDTLGRQTGMYRVTQLIRDDQAEGVIRTTCDRSTSCLRTNVWDLSAGHPHSLTEPLNPIWPTREVPVYCVEACNILVAACRPVAKINLPTPSS